METIILQTILLNISKTINAKDFIKAILKSPENTSKIISIGILITERQPFKRMKILSILACFISKIKKPDVFNFSSIKYFVKCFLFLKIWNVRANYCGSYGPSNLLFCFTGHNLETLNNRQREAVVNSIVHYFKC